MIRKGHVIYKNEIAGILTEMPYGGTSFSYLDKWIDLPIACSFPINQRLFEWEKGLHPFFQNLCPEGWLRDGQAKVGKIDNIDDFGFLLRFGKDCIGAVGLIGLPEEKVTTQTDEILASINSNKTISGVQKKLLAYKENDKFHASIDGKPATHIAKFNTEQLPDLVRNENLSLKLAQKILGITHVTNFSVDTLGLGRQTALIVERFDRKDNTKLRMEEFAQILGKSSNDKYNGSYEEIANAILEYSTSPQPDLYLYFKQVVFSIIIGNCDAHLKNFALIETPEGLKLSPAYDLVNTLMYPSYDRVTALKLLGEQIYYDQINRKILIEFGKKIGLKPKAVMLALDELNRSFKGGKAREILKPPAAEEPNGFCNRYKEIVDGACIRILEE